MCGVVLAHWLAALRLAADGVTAEQRLELGGTSNIYENERTAHNKFIFNLSLKVKFLDRPSRSPTHHQRPQLVRFN